MPFVAPSARENSLQPVRSAQRSGKTQRQSVVARPQAFHEIAEVISVSPIATRAVEGARQGELLGLK